MVLLDDTSVSPKSSLLRVTATENSQSNMIGINFFPVVYKHFVRYKSESEPDSKLPPLAPRRQSKIKYIGILRQPNHNSKTGINYKGMFVLSSEQASISNETTSNIFESDYAHLRSLDLYGKDFKSILATKSLINIHIC